MKTVKLIVALLIISNLAIACDHASEGGDSNTKYDGLDVLALDEELDTRSPQVAAVTGMLAFHDDNSGNWDFSSDAQSQGGGEEQAETSNKKIIRNAQLNLQVANYQKAKALVWDIVKKNGAEIEKEEEHNLDYRIEAEMVLRIKPDKLEDFLVALETIGTQVHYKSIESKDVTKQYIDLESRLANKQAVVKRYRELLADARNVTEVLAVEEKLRLITEEIESTQKTLKYLQGQIDRSVVNLRIFQDIENGQYQRPGFWAQMGEAFGDGWYGFKQFLVGLFGLWPFIILFGGLGYLYVRWRRNRLVKKG